MNKLELNIVGDTQVVITRQFALTPEQLYQAHTECHLIQRWMLGPDGWSMPVCSSDVRPGGEVRFEWANAEGHSFYLTGEYIELEPFRRIVHVERMHLPDPTPDNHVETTFEANESGTLMTMVMTLPSAEVRAMMLQTGMEHGMEISYARLESQLAS